MLLVCLTRKVLFSAIIIAVWFTIIGSADVEFEYFDPPLCSFVKEGLASPDAVRNYTCGHRECTDTGAVFDFPVTTLKAYKSYSGLVLVTEDGCLISEKDNLNMGLKYIRLIVPHGSCNSKKQKLPGGYVRYDSRPYIAYIGDHSRYYVTNISCTIKPKLPDIKVDWDDALDAINDTITAKSEPAPCWSSSTDFTVPCIGNAEVSLQLAQLKNYNNDTSIHRYEPGKISENITEGTENIAKTLPSRSYTRATAVGTTIDDRAFTFISPNRTWSAVATVKEDNRQASFSVLPHCALGRTYVVVSYPSSDSHVIITAPHLRSMAGNVTVVEIRDPSGILVSKMSLQRLSSTILPNAKTGYLISSDWPVNVVTVMLDAKVPWDGYELTEDHMVEQVPPVTLWGSEYVVQPVSSSDNRSDSGFLLQIVTHGRGVQLEYFGVNGASFPKAIKPHSYETIDIDDPNPFTLKSKNGANFMVAMIGKSGDVNDSGPKPHPYMIILQPTRSFFQFVNWGPQDDARQQKISIVTQQSTIPEMHYNDASDDTLNPFWTKVACNEEENTTCVDSSYAYLQGVLLPGKQTSLFFSDTDGFGGVMVTSSVTDVGGSTGHSGPATFKHVPVQDDWCDPEWTHYEPTDQCIGIVHDSVLWSEAKKTCESFGGSLVTMETAEKATFIFRLASQLSGRLFHAVGFNIQSGSLRWLNKGQVHQDGQPLQGHGSLKTNNCGFLKFIAVTVENIDQISGYVFYPLPCSSSLPFICEKAAVPPSCLFNLCLNNGTCRVVSNSSSCDCVHPYTGPYCGEMKLPARGIYDVSGEGIAFAKLVKQHGQNTGSQAVSDTSLTFEVLTFGSMHSFRLVPPCSDNAVCYGWLTKTDFGRVIISPREKGVYLIRIVPHKDGYYFGFDSSPNYISYSRRYNYFYVGLEGTETILFKLKSSHRYDVMSAPHLVKLRMQRYIMPGLMDNTPPQIIGLHVPRTQCPGASQVTSCLWFRAYQGPKSTSVPELGVYDTTYDVAVTEWIEEWVAPEEHRLFSLKPIESTPDTVKIGVWGKEEHIMIASTAEFPVPSRDYRHHLCLGERGMTLDGVYMKFNLEHATRRFNLHPKKISHITIGPFLGEIDGFDAWCAKNNYFIFRESAILPECAVHHRGDQVSMQWGKAQTTEHIKRITFYTPESACYFCYEDWAPHHGSCFRVEQSNTAASKSALGGVCTADFTPQIPWPGVVTTTVAHNFAARYHDSNIAKIKRPMYFGLHLGNTSKWEWSHASQTPISQFFWGKGEPYLTTGDNVCGMYKSFQSTERWVPMPAATEITPGPTSVNNYQWGVGPCTDIYPNLCELKSSVLSRERQVILRLFMMEGSFVARHHVPPELRVYLNTMKDIVNAMDVASSNPMQYQMIRIRARLKVTPVVGSTETFLTNLGFWRPRQGKANLRKALQYIIDTRDRGAFRYINIVTSAYSQDVIKPIPKNSSMVFALGIMRASESHLQEFAAHPACVDFAKTGRDVPAKLLSCLAGTF